MKIGLDLVNWRRVPSDSIIHVTGRNIKKVLIKVDVSAADLLLARLLGCDAVIAHHPIGISARSFSKVFSRHVEFMIQEGVPKYKALSAVQELKKI
jgi:putative NIF3 family GTP cyclohydrolase 1 type 2